MPSRRTARKAAALERFRSAVTDFVTGLGARPGTFYDFELDTPAGLLHLSVNEGWLATRFDDVALGRAFTESCGRPSNPYSGKWNFHYSDCIGTELVLGDLRYWFVLLTDWRPAESPT